MSKEEEGVGEKGESLSLYKGRRGDAPPHLPGTTSYSPSAVIDGAVGLPTPSSSLLTHSRTLELQRPSSCLSSQTTPSMSGAGGKWMVSSVTEENITKLREDGYLAADITHRLQDAGQIIPTPEPHERVGGPELCV